MNFKKIVRKAYFAIGRMISLFEYQIVSEKVLLEKEDAEQYLRTVIPQLESTALTKHVFNKIEYDLMIIVPAFNSEKWIKDCVESIINQKTVYSFQVVFIDDGSTDRTGVILDEYSSNYHVKIIHQKNKGYSGARNVALENINSQYIMFVDSDDYLLPNAIQILMSKAYETNADIVEGNGFRFNENGRLGTVKGIQRKNVEDSYWGAPWMKVMKSTLWECFEFPEGYLYEDTIISALIFPMAKKIYCVSDEIYAYRIHDNSITQKHDENLRRVDSYWIMLLMYKIQKALGIPIDYMNYRRVMKQIVFTFRRTILLPDEVKKSIFIGTHKFITENFANFLNEKDEYYLLAKALIKKDYAKYSVYCKKLAY